MLAHLAGCSTLNTVPEGFPLAVGDEVLVVTRSGEERNLRLTAVTADTICAASGCIARAEISAVERRDFSPVKTTLLVAVIIGLAVALAYAAAADAAAGALAP